MATTWHVDGAEACEYVLFASGGARPSVLAIVSDHPELEACLERLVRDSDRT